MRGTADYFSLVKHIREGRLTDKVFLFFGPEGHLVEEAVRLVTDHYLEPGSRDFNFLKLDARETDAGQLADELSALPIFSEHRVLIISNADKYFGTAKKRNQEEEDLIIRYLEHPNSACCLIFLMEGKPDSRRKIFKQLKACGQAVDFAPLKDYQLASWLKEQLEKRGRGITPEALNYLIATSANDLAVFEQELEKLMLFAPDNPEISLDMVKLTVSKTAGAGIFDLVDAVGEKKVTRAVDLLREMLVAGEPPVYILFMLARQYRLMLSVKSLLRQRVPEKQVQSRLSLHPYAFKKVLQQAKNFNEKELREGLRYLLEADVGLKNSFGEPGYLLEMAILKISS